MKSRLLCFLVVGLGVVMATDQPTYAGVTGKIRGKITDTRTGGPLPGVNVIITKVWDGDRERDFSGSIGAASDANGEYIILHVPPGGYTLSARLIGYAQSSKPKVRVSVDRTTFVDFSLQEEAIELGEVVVEAKRDLVQLDVSATESYISSEDYEGTPFANRVEDVIGMQSGITGNIIEGEIKIREGEANEVGFLVDGISMVDRKFNRPVMTINPGVVQEIKIMRNGFSAEYGESRSGIINVVTKDPSDEYHFTVDYQLEPARKRHAGRDIYDPGRNWPWRLLTGPAAMDGDTLLLNEGKDGIVKTWVGWNKKAVEYGLSPEDAQALWMWRHRPMKYGDRLSHNVDLTASGPVPSSPWDSRFLAGIRYERRPFTFPQSRQNFDERVGSLKITNDLSTNTKLVLNGVYSETRTVTQGMSTSEWSEEDRISYSGGGRESYYPFRKPTIDRYASIAGVRFTHTLSPRTYYEINFNHFYTKWHMGRGDSARVADGRVFGGKLYLDPQSGWIPREKGVDDYATGNRMHGGGFTWDDSYNRRYVFKADVTSQVLSSHEIKAGLQFDYDLQKEDRLHWDNEDPEQLFERQYDVKPFQVGLYVQDKIEFEGMIANFGVRFDYFDLNGEQPDLHRTLEYDDNEAIFIARRDGTYPTFRPKAKTYLSPRIGISHPLTESSKIYFNFGHFVQRPLSQGLFSSTLDYRMPRVQWMPNANMDFEKTIAYELGFDQSFLDQYQLHIGGFYKEYKDLAMGMVYAHADQSLVLEWAGQRFRQDIRGIEVEVRKSVGRFLTGWLNYNWIKKSRSDMSVPGLSCCPIITDNPLVGINGELKGIPRQDITTVAPYGRGIVTLRIPTEWGPEVSGIDLLGNTAFNFQVYYQGGGQRNHPDGAWRDAHPDIRFKELDRYWANLRISRRVNWGRLASELYLDVSNIYHSKFRSIPGGQAGIDYYNDLFDSGRLDQVGTDELSDPSILNSEATEDELYAGKYKYIIFGLRLWL